MSIGVADLVPGVDEGGRRGGGQVRGAVGDVRPVINHIHQCVCHM